MTIGGVFKIRVAFELALSISWAGVSEFALSVIPWFILVVRFMILLVQGVP